MKCRSISGLAGLIGLLFGVGAMGIAAAPATALERPASRALAEGVGMGVKPDAGVRDLQRQLWARGRSLGPTGVDGRFGPRTARAVRDLQASFGLAPDGVVGPKTRKLLRTLCKSGGCPRRHGTRVSNQRPTGTGGALPGAARPSSNDGSLNAAPTVIALLALLVLALAYGWWRSQREKPASVGDEDLDEPLSAARLGEDDLDEALPPARRVVGYLGEIQAGLPGTEVRAREEALEAAIEAECTRRGWELLHVFREVPGGNGREALVYALERIGAGDATCLMVSELERVGSSAVELGYLLEWFAKVQAGLVVLDVGVDTTSREGATAANMLVSVTKPERTRALARAGNGWRAGLPESGQ